ncbi:MAG: CoB--CoM heterodisulfide reductase iron-sulfur subunit B family protein [Dehalococcoidia bacterium]|nr:CoB--CoM heterodisulfide reductase iron-sulfur subunit B family protein [Dehalococcoidia bacterium]
MGISMTTASYAYYPGCTLHATAKEYDASARAVCEKMGIGLEELKDWTCCGASSAHTTNEMLAIALPARDLLAAEKMGKPIAVACALCFNRLKVTEHELASDKSKLETVRSLVGSDYANTAEVVHLLQILYDRRSSIAVSRPLKGLKVASYYGCMLVRPHEITQFDDPEDPQMMDKLMVALGAQALEWDFKTACCGASLPLTRRDILLKLSHRILAQAQQFGADCLAVACPMCQFNLDMYQQAINKEYGEKINLPILYFTQLAGLAMGLSLTQLHLDKHIVDPVPVLRKKGLA